MSKAKAVERTQGGGRQRQASKPLSPERYALEMFRTPKHLLKVKQLRTKYEVLIPQRNCPEGLAEEIEEYLRKQVVVWVKVALGESPDFAPARDLAINEMVAGLLPVWITHVLTGVVRAVPREMSGAIYEVPLKVPDGSTQVVMHIVGTAITDWRRLAREMVEHADKLYGPPPKGRRAESSQYLGFIEACRNEGDSDPAVIADKYMEAHPERYPLAEVDPGFKDLKEAIRKECDRHPS